MRHYRVLSIDDDDRFTQQSLVDELGMSYEVQLTSSFEDGWKILHQKKFDILLLDRHLDIEGLSGIDLIPSIKEHFPNLAVIILTYDAHYYGISQALSVGASDYIVKSKNLIPDLKIRIPEAIKRANIAQAFLRTQKTSYVDDCPLIGSSQFVVKLDQFLKRISEKSHNVHIDAQYSSGARTVARAIWRSENDPFRPFDMLDAASLKEEDLVLELFGKASTNSDISYVKSGLLVADSGDLFIEEIHLLSLEVWIGPHLNRQIVS